MSFALPLKKVSFSDKSAAVFMDACVLPLLIASERGIGVNQSPEAAVALIPVHQLPHPFARFGSRMWHQEEDPT
ncbi:hypothetical protein ACWGS9_23610 [Bradyrhizobium sp. Arg314]